jgi:hypothetical protein
MVSKAFRVQFRMIRIHLVDGGRLRRDSTQKKFKEMIGLSREKA